MSPRRATRVSFWLVAAASLPAIAPAGVTTRLLTPVMAQPGATVQPGKFKVPPLTPENRAAVRKAMAWNAQGQLCSFPISLRVTRGTLQDVVAGIQAALPQRAAIEVRANSPARYTLDLHGTTIGEILSGAATLAGCSVYAFNDHLLLATVDQLSDAERAEAKVFNSNLGEQIRVSAESNGQQVFLDVITSTLAAGAAANAPAGAESATGRAAGSLRLGDLSPELQQMIQQLMAWTLEKHRFPNLRMPRLTADGLVSFSSVGGQNSLELKFDSSQNSLYRWTESPQSPGVTWMASFPAVRETPPSRKQRKEN